MPRSNAWSREELDFLADHYELPGWTPPRIAREKPGTPRSPAAVRSVAYQLGLKAHDQYGRHCYDRAMHDDVYDLVVLDYTGPEIARAIHAQHGVPVSADWVRYVIRLHLPAGVHAGWVKRIGERRSRAVAKGWEQRRRNAA